MEWFNEPDAWRQEEQSITVKSQAKTDFWRKTHNDAVRDNGHFYGRDVTGDFLVEVDVSGQYVAQFDQAGLMLRVDEANWLKCGIEFVDGIQHASAVVTRDYSDWSVVPLSDPVPTFHLRLSRAGETVEVHYALGSGPYALLRLAYLPIVDPVKVGLMCASPVGDGFTVRFDGFKVTSAESAR
jgi:uncharacterized protein